MKNLLLLCCCLPLIAHSQNAEILKNAAVDWAAQIELTLPADPFMFSNEDGGDAEMGIIKLVAGYYGVAEGIDHSLNSKIWTMVKSEQWELYTDPELARRLPFEEMMRKFAKPDTSVTFDPETYEERVRISYEDYPLPFEAPYIKVRQLLYYQNSSATFDVRTIAVAPCFADGKTAFWLKIPTTPVVVPESVVSDPAISWAARYITDRNCPSEKNWQVVKNNTGPVITRFIDRIRNDTTVHLYDGEEMEYLGARRQCLFSCADTIATFDPQTWKETVQVVKSGLDFESLEDLQLVEEWYWQEEQGALITRLVAVAPRCWRSTDGEPAYLQPRFYRVFRQ